MLKELSNLFNSLTIIDSNFIFEHKLENIFLVANKLWVLEPNLNEIFVVCKEVSSVSIGFCEAINSLELPLWGLGLGYVGVPDCHHTVHCLSWDRFLAVKPLSWCKPFKLLNLLLSNSFWQQIRPNMGLHFVWGSGRCADVVRVLCELLLCLIHLSWFFISENKF